MQKEPWSLEAFAYKKQAPVDALINAVLNTAITLGGLKGLDVVHVVPQPPPTGSFSHSLFGSLFPMAIIMTFVVTLVGVRMTVKKRVAGEVVPGLPAGVTWFKGAVGTAALRAFAAFGVISMFGLVVHYQWPAATVSVTAAAVIVAMVAAVLAYIESVGAVLGTRRLSAS